MSERYVKIFTLKDNLYSDDVPILISAGALRKDNQTGKVFAQLRLQNTDAKFRNLIALKVSFTAYDPAGNILGVAKEHHYLDLDVPRGSEFGGNIPVALDHSATRSFEVTVLEVVFSEGTPWIGNQQEWISLGKQKTLEASLGEELAEQYRRDTFSGAKYELFANKGIWMCACGALNTVGENSCCHCHNNKSILVKALDHSALTTHLNDHKAKINKQIQQMEEEKKTTAKKIMLILLPFILIGIFFGVKSYVSYQREEALRLEQERIEEALRLEQERINALLEAEKRDLEVLLCSDDWVETQQGKVQIYFRFYEGGTGDFANTSNSGGLTWKVVDGDTFEVYCPTAFGSNSVHTLDMTQIDGTYTFSRWDHQFYRLCDLD